MKKGSGCWIWVTILLASALISGCQAPASQPSSAPQPPLEFIFKDLDGQEVTLSELRGKVVLLNYWASWCSPCREEMPLLDSFYQEHKDSNFTLIAINVSESPKEAKAFIEEHGFSFPVWTDPPGNSLIEFGLRGLPASIILDAEGRRQFIWIGPFTQEYLDELVLPMILSNKQQ